MVERAGAGRTIIAGYPWFTDWGRDTMISLPGLCLATGRFAEAREILVTFARALDRGMIPNVFPDAGQSARVQQRRRRRSGSSRAAASTSTRRGDLEPPKTVLLPALRRHRRASTARARAMASASTTTACCARATPATQLTWMDAKVGDWVVTPRRGKPVEVQALWIDALETTADLARRLGDDAGAANVSSSARPRARRSRDASGMPRAATSTTWSTFPDGRDDATLRPNQIFAVALPRTPILDEERWRAPVVAVVERELLTPFGLRTLARGDHRYAPRYGGDVRARDGAYHQGTVWPWLIGPYVTAYLRATDVRPRRWPQARGAVEGLIRLPRRPTGSGRCPSSSMPKHRRTRRGCIAQAWSVAELVRVLVRELKA